MRGAILHVGANTKSDCLGLPGPLHKSGIPNYEFIPIPECVPREYRGVCPTYEELGLARWVPSRRIEGELPKELPVHTDPEFETFTFGDYWLVDEDPPKARPKPNPRMTAARHLVPGDFLFFIASLADHNLPERPFRGYYVIAYFELQQIESTVRIMEDPVLFEVFKKNAHLRKDYYKRAYDERLGCMIFKGKDKPNSQRLPRAVPFSTGAAPNALARKVVPNLDPKAAGRWWSRALLPEESVRLLLSEIRQAQEESWEGV